MVVGYCMDDLNRQFEQILQQHDLLGTQFSPGTKRKAFLLHQNKTIIAAQMTALLQLTDIMSAAKAKKIVRSSRVELKRLLKRRAIAENSKVVHKCGKREIMWVCKRIAEDLEEWNKEEKYIVKGMRTSGMFAWRPDLEQQKLVRADEQEWAKEFPLGEGGKVEAEWMEERYSWLDKDGKPIKPDWTRQSTGKELEDMREVDYCERYVKEQDILVTAEEQDIFNEDDKLLQKHPKVRERKHREELKKCTQQGRGLPVEGKLGAGANIA